MIGVESYDKWLLLVLFCTGNMFTASGTSSICVRVTWFLSRLSPDQMSLMSRSPLMVLSMVWLLSWRLWLLIFSERRQFFVPIFPKLLVSYGQIGALNWVA
eukprot:12894404-Prorocentrum_lima.AAC.1